MNSANSAKRAAERSHGWYHAVQGWLLSNPGVGMFNRELSVVAGNKPAVLLRARQVGLPVPSTIITNDMGTIESLSPPLIAKPVGGGDFCYALTELLPRVDFRAGVASVPAIVQERLVSPEIRIYVVGSAFFAFEMRSDSLDYRVKQDVEVLPLDDVPIEVERMRSLMAGLGMNFGAADFKTDKVSGRLVFLELNTSPMFARFSECSGGSLARSLVKELVHGCQ